MNDKFRVMSLSELEVPPRPDSARWALVRHTLGIRAFGVNAWTSTAAGQDIIGEHDELGTTAAEHEELYVVMSGHAVFTIDGAEIDAPAGTFVFVRDPATKRKAVGVEAETTVLAVGAKPGVAFTPSQWERSAPAFGYFGTKEYDKAREVLSAIHDEYPDDAGALFNLACAESLLGRADDAIDHLRRAIELEGRFRELAQRDSDFDAMREDPRFEELVG